ncbi:MAG: restriction endonuclease subunit S, partial [Eubacterium sp.]|nr:restriction endonuclease subunit S [Eubacterium sp.]
LIEQQRIVAKVDELMALCDELEAAEKELDTLEERFAEYLPKAILQAAVQGKLVPQNPHDEPAVKLLERIRHEKAKLIKEGKIKKEKPLHPITADEIPYNLPQGWIWCRLGDIVLENIGGGTPSKQNENYWNGDIPWASVKDLSGDTLSITKDTITVNGLTQSTSNLIPAGNVIVCTRMGLGKIAINNIDVAINQDLRALFLPDNIDKNYFLFFYKSQNILGSGMTVKGISIDELNTLPFPLPPLAEQQRIVAKVDELMALCEELKDARSISHKKTEATVIPFAQHKEYEDEIGVAARGDATQPFSPKLQKAIASLLED